MESPRVGLGHFPSLPIRRQINVNYQINERNTWRGLILVIVVMGVKEPIHDLAMLDQVNRL
jgi:hypothetical protein